MFVSFSIDRLIFLESTQKSTWKNDFPHSQTCFQDYKSLDLEAPLRDFHITSPMSLLEPSKQHLWTGFPTTVNCRGAAALAPSLSRTTSSLPSVRQGAGHPPTVEPQQQEQPPQQQTTEKDCFSWSALHSSCDQALASTALPSAASTSTLVHSSPAALPAATLPPPSAPSAHQSPPRSAFVWGDMGMDTSAMDQDDNDADASTLSFLVSNTTLSSPAPQWTYLS